MAAQLDKALVPFNAPLNGRLITKLDGALIPDAHFQVLENFRYNDGGIEPINGMTKINATVLPKLKVQNGFHFKKSIPAEENHIFVQISDATTSAIYKSNNTTTIPAQDTFSLFQTLSSLNTVYFSEAPDQSMIFCDGFHNFVYSGNEYRVAKVMNFDPAGSYSYDYTRIANNNLTSTENVFSVTADLGGGADANTMLLMHMNNTLGDSSPTTPHTPVSFGWSNASYLDEKFTDISGWTDTDQGTGASTAATYDSRTTLKATNGASAGAGNYSLVTKDVGTLTSTYAITIILNLDLVGTLANNDYFEMAVDNGEIGLTVRFASDGLYVFDGSAFNEVGTNITVADQWQEYTFVVNSTTPASATCAVYLDDALVNTSVDCSNATTATNGLVQLRQYGTTTINQITYVDRVLIGTAVNAVSFSGTCVFGSFAATVDSAETDKKSCITIPDNGDFDFSGGSFCIDMRFRALNLTANQPIWYQGTDNANYFYVYVSTAGAVVLSVYEADSEVVALSTAAGAISADTFYHVEINENANNWYIFVNGVQQATVSDANRCANYTGVAKIGASNAKIGAYGSWIIDEVRVSNVYRHIAGFSVPLVAYDTTSGNGYMYIGSTRPLDGIKFYVSTVNSSTSSVVIYYWNGSAWTAVGSLVDGTATGGITLSKTGTMSFTSTVGLCKIKAIKENPAYYYQIVFTGVDTATRVSQISVSAPVQDLVDIWDGDPRQIYSFITYISSAFADLTLNVYDIEYDASDATTYASIGGMTTSDYIYMGFNEALLGFKMYFGGTNVNTNAAVMDISYWNGKTWTDVGAIDDGTIVSGKSGNRSGVVTWNPPTSNLEYINSVGNSSEWFYYRIHWNATLSATVRLDHVTGIPTQVNIMPYRFPVLWQNRLWLLNNQSDNKNTALGSSFGTVCVFNGADSGVLSFGGSKELNSGKTLFTRYGGSLYENLIACKNNETYLVDGYTFTGDSAFKVYQVSGTRGCIAPLTMKQCDIGYEIAPGVTKHILTWLSNAGVIMFDSNSMIEIGNDIGDRFFTDTTYSINKSISSKSSGFYDSTKGEYHLLIPTGSSIYLNEEFIYDVVRKKWGSVKRGAKYLWCGFEVEDTSGNKYVYGGTGDGYIERLEYGTTIDGLGITYKFRTPDSLLNQSWDVRKEIRSIRVVGKCKTTTTQTIALSHYADGSSTASTPAIVNIPNVKIGRRIFKFQRSVSLIGTTHSIEVSITTDNEAGGFAPLYLAGHYRVVDYDLEEK